VPATFTIEGEFSEQGLLEVKTAIESVLGKTGGIPAAENEIPGAHDLALRKARLLRQWAGQASWHFVSVIAQCYQPDQAFTFDDLSGTFNEGKETVKSWHRSASKIMKKVNAELGTEPRFLEDWWDGERQHYRMPEVMRDAIIEAGS
jgi:hypothetical protein